MSFARGSIETFREIGMQKSSPLKGRTIVVCPFKGAFDSSPAFQGWVEKFQEMD